MNLATPAARPLSPRRWQMALLGFSFAAFAVFGSLVPLKYTPLPWNEAAARFRQIAWLELGVVHRADWIANILLFVPLGFFGLAAFELDRRRGWRTLFTTLFTLAWCAALSLAIEFTQLWFPPRTVSLNDLIAESIGALVGSAVWLALGARVVAQYRQWLATAVGQGLAAVALPVYLVLLLATRLYPLDVTISPGELYDKYQAGRILLVPFRPVHNDWGEALAKYAENAVFFAPLGWLIAHVAPLRLGPKQTWLTPLVVGLAVCGSIEALQSLIISRYCDVTDILMGVPLTVGTWGLARRLSPYIGAEATVTPSTPAEIRRWRSSGVWLTASLVWVAVLAYAFWRPFHFELDSAKLAVRLEQFSLLPFYDYYRQSEFKSFDNVVRRIIVFLPLGGMLSLAGRVFGVGLRRTFCLFGVAGVASGLEVGQFFLPDRLPSMTDCTLGIAGGMLGMLLAEKLMPLVAPATVSRASA